VSPEERPRLEVETPQGQTVHALEDELIIGRAGQLAIPDARVSRRHARIRCSESGSYTLEDLGSANGTFVNEEKIAEPHRLEDLDVIRIGSFRITFRLPELSSTFESPPPAEPVPLLLVSCGTRTVEEVLGDELPLDYQIHIGPARVGGVAGRLVNKQGEYWLEPAPGRQQVTVNGARATNPVRLNPGDTLQLGVFRLEFRREPPTA
jgi:pSer/pThr/pTyr-binding forkhead associated (FHA) protein